jgi:sulfite reductase (ferredoxin)
VGDRLLDFLPAAEALYAAEAGRRLFEQVGDRSNRNRARLRHAVRRMGAEAFAEAFKASLAEVRADESVPRLEKLAATAAAATGSASVKALVDLPADAAGLRVWPGRDEGHVTVSVHCPQGNIAGDLLAALAGLADEFSAAGELRLSRRQNLLIPGVPVAQFTGLLAALRELEAVPASYPVLDSFVACTGASTCRLGVCLSKNVSAQAASVLANAGLDSGLLSGLEVRISGCPNSCAQHQVFDIGLFGGARRQDERHIPGYQLLLGGTHHEESTRFGEAFGFVPTKAVPACLTALVQSFQAGRQGDETFADYVQRRGLAELRREHQQFLDLPDYETTPDYYRDWGCSTDFKPGQATEGECGAGASSPQEIAVDANGQLDLRGVPCPLNFVHARLAMEKAEPGVTITFLLDDGDPVNNVSRSFGKEGFEIRSKERQPAGHWRVRVKARVSPPK